MLPQFAIAGHGSEPGGGRRGAAARGRGAEEPQPPPPGRSRGPRPPRSPMPDRRRRGARGGPGARSCLLWLFVLLKVSAGKGRAARPAGAGPPLCARLRPGGEGSARLRLPPLCAPAARGMEAGPLRPTPRSAGESPLSRPPSCPKLRGAMGAPRRAPRAVLQHLGLTPAAAPTAARPAPAGFPRSCRERRLTKAGGGGRAACRFAVAEFDIASRSVRALSSWRMNLSKFSVMPRACLGVAFFIVMHPML